MDNLAPFVNAGAAGAVIAVVVLFLRYLTVQRNEDRLERQSERSLWAEAAVKQATALESHTTKITDALSKVVEKVSNCPNTKEHK